MSVADVIILGDGVVAAALAEALAGRGRRVMRVPDGPGAAISQDAAGGVVRCCGEVLRAAYLVRCDSPGVLPQGRVMVCRDGDTGLGDAAALGWRLAARLDGWAGPGMLDAYIAERWGAGEPPSGMGDMAGLVLPEQAVGGVLLAGLLGEGMTLLCGRSEIDTSPLQAEAGVQGMPLVVLDVPLGPGFSAPLVLVRPDGIVAWSGAALPGDLPGFVRQLCGVATES